ncbi:MAG: hypothetical protein K8T91_11955 [Planctomycetes bacterium]|nr:hypothetical protein [Planctomycetota bacterium]
MIPWASLASLILVSIAVLGIARHLRNRRDHLPDHATWYVDTTADLELKDDAAVPLAPRDFQEAQRDFYRRQFRRRMQGSIMLGAVGLLLPLGGWIEDGMLNLAYLALLLALVGWMLMLGIADLVATRHHFERVREQLLAEALAGVRPDSDVTATQAKPRPDTPEP